jgi:hypothetical protein
MDVEPVTSPSNSASTSDARRMLRLAGGPGQARPTDQPDTRQHQGIVQETHVHPSYPGRDHVRGNRQQGP